MPKAQKVTDALKATDARPVTLDDARAQLKRKSIDFSEVQAVLAPVTTLGPCELLYFTRGGDRRRAEVHMDGKTTTEEGW